MGGRRLSKFRIEIEEKREIDPYLAEAISILDAACTLLNEFNGEDSVFGDQEYIESLRNVKSELESVKECFFLPCSQSLKDLDGVKDNKNITEKSFAPYRVNRFQSYLASHWAIYEQLSHQAFILISLPDKIKNKTEFRNQKTIFSSPALVQYRVAVSLLSRYGWKAGLSYCLRNAYLHESGRNISFETNTPSESSFLIMRDSWKSIRNSTSDFLKGSAAQIKNMPEPDPFMSWIVGRDLLEVLKECHHAADALHGTLLKTAATTLLTDVEILLKPKSMKSKKSKKSKKINK